MLIATINSVRDLALRDADQEALVAVDLILLAVGQGVETVTEKAIEDRGRP